MIDQTNKPVNQIKTFIWKVPDALDYRLNMFTDEPNTIPCRDSICIKITKYQFEILEKIGVKRVDNHG